MFAYLTAAFRQAGVRRAVSMLCAVTFIAFTFIHATHHCGIADASPAQIELAVLDGSSGDTDKTPEAGHCCNCSTAAMIVVDALLSTDAPASRHETAAWRVPHPYVAPADIRPPIA